MYGKAHAGKKKSYAHSYVQYMCTCVRAYMRACVRTYAYTHVRMCAWTHEYAYDVFPREPSHAGLYESPRYRHASRYRGLPHVRTHVACTHVRMCACAHVRTYEYAYDVFPAWAFPRIGVCESRYRSLPLASDPFKKRTSLCVSLVLPRPHTIMCQNRINKFFWENWRRFCIFSATCADSGCQNVKKSSIEIEKNLGRSPAYVRVYMYIRTYFTWYSR